jgi:hypothetical protein
METSWNPTQQMVTDHRNALESAARDQRLLKRARRNRRQLRRTRRNALARVLDPSPSVYRPHPAI